MSKTKLPDASGHFGPYGGRFVAETLMEPLDELTAAYEKLKNDASFQAESLGWKGVGAALVLR